MKNRLNYIFLVIILIISCFNIMSFKNEKLVNGVDKNLIAMKSKNEIDGNESFEHAYSINQGSFLDVKSYSGKIDSRVNSRRDDYFTFNIYAKSEVILEIDYDAYYASGLQLILYKHRNIPNPTFDKGGLLEIISKSPNNDYVLPSLELDPGTYYIKISSRSNLQTTISYSLKYQINLVEKDTINIRDYASLNKNGYYLWESDFQVLETSYYGADNYFIGEENSSGKFPHILINEYFELGGFMTSELYMWGKQFGNIVGAYLNDYADKLDEFVERYEKNHNKNIIIKDVIYVHKVLYALFNNLRFFQQLKVLDLSSIIDLTNKIKINQYDVEKIKYLSLYYKLLANDLVSEDGIVAMYRISSIKKIGNKYYLTNEIANTSTIESRSKYLTNKYYENDNIYDIKQYLFSVLGYKNIYGECKEANSSIDLFKMLENTNSL